MQDMRGDRSQDFKVQSQIHKRRGMSLVEVVCSLFVVVILSSLALSCFSTTIRLADATNSYSRLKIYATDLIERIESDMSAHEDGVVGAEEITAIDYSDDGVTEDAHGNYSWIEADVEITDLGEVLSKQAYLVRYDLKDTLTGTTVSGKSFIREGSVIHVP